MSEIHPVNSSGPLHRVNTQPQATPQASSNGVSRGGDSVEVSATASLLAKLAELPDTREDLVTQVRSEIDAGTYLTDEKVDIAVDAMLEDWG